MNKIITTHVKFHGSLIPVEQLKDQSQLEVEVECPHGRRSIRWSRRNQLCKQCAAEAGVFNTCPKGRIITWGDKISKAKKGVEFTEEHKKALSEAHLGVPLSKAHIEAQNKNRPRGSSHHNWKDTSSEQKKIRKRISNAICDSLKERGFSKSRSISKSLEYSIEDLCKHLESKFQSNMTWDNYGDWHIDHIKPESWFQYNSDQDSQFKECWSLDNLQPLWALDNVKKGNRFIG